MVTACNCPQCITKYRLFWTSETRADWNHESHLGAVTLNVIEEWVREVEKFVDVGFSSAYDWRLELA